MPSIASSLRMRGAPRSRSPAPSSGSGSRPRGPARGGPDAGPAPLQNLPNPSRCQRITVAGSTIARASLQPVHTCDSTPRRLGPTPRVADVGHRAFGSAPRPAAAVPGSRERAPAGSETATSSSRGRSRGEPTPHRPYPLNMLRLKASLQDGLLGKHRPRRRAPTRAGTLRVAWRRATHCTVKTPSRSSETESVLTTAPELESIVCARTRTW